MPHFLANLVAGPVMLVEPSELFGAYLQEYRDLGDEFHSTMTFSYFCNMKSRSRLRGFNRAFNQNFELQRTLGRLTIPNFDGTSSCSARIWVQKLDTYFQLKPMIETDAIKRLSAKPEIGNNSTPPSPIDQGSTSNSGKVAYTNIQNTPHIYSIPSNRPTMPHFLGDVVGGPDM